MKAQVLLIGCCLLTVSLTVQAQLLPNQSAAFQEIEFLTRQSGVGVRAMGMGGAMTGLADDYSAGYWNPAGLAFLKGGRIYGSLSNQESKNDIAFFQTVTNGRQSITKFNTLGGLWSVPVYRGGVTLSLGFNRVANYNNITSFQGFNTKSDNQVLQAEDITEEGSLNHVVVSGAVEVMKDFSVGLGIRGWYGTYKYNTFFQEVDVDDIYTMAEYRLNRYLDTDITGYDVQVGFLYRPNKFVRFGGTITSPRTYSLTDNFRDSDILEYDADDGRDPEETLDEGVFEYEVRLPFEFSFGAALTYPLATLSGSVTYADYAQTRFLTEPPFQMARPEANREIRNGLEPVLVSRIGAELHLKPINSQLRFGFTHIPSPHKTVSSDQDRKYVSLGAGYNLGGNASFDVAYVRGLWKRNSVDDLIASPILEDITENKMLMSVSIHF